MDATSFSHRSKAIALSGVLLVVTFALVGLVSRRDNGSFARPTIDELHSTALDGASAYDQRSIQVEGFWCSYYGLSIGSKVDGDSSILVRPDPDAFPGYEPSLISDLLRWVMPDPAIVSDDDRVRVSGVYHARGWQPQSLLQNCGWLEISLVEIWDSRLRRWKRATSWR